MQFNDDTDLPDPGDHVILDDEDLGSATYDSDHDGVADSVIVGQEDYSVVITDSDHDGEADSVKAYDHEGNQVDPRTGASVGDGSAGDGSAGDDSSGDSTTGGTGTEGQVDPTGHTTGTDDGQPGEADGSTTETSSGTEGQPGESSGMEPTGDQGDAGTGDGTTDGTTDGGITVIGDDGTPVTVGQPTADLNGDGTPDTAVVQNHDGSTTGYTDVDGDGHADQITQINADGSVVIAVSDGDGHWQVESTGHIETDGTYVEDPKTGDEEPDVPAVPAGAETAADDSSNIESGTTITFTSADGQAYPLGPPTADLSGDGRLDTVVNQLPDGTVVGYSDIDGDGQADQVTQIDPDGAVTIGVPDGSGGWEQAATGRIGDGGEFVPDGGVPESGTPVVA
jgi:hypothetical protein